MTEYKVALGILGETIASTYLKEKGFSIIRNNYRTRFGEVDIIAKKENKLHFVEVKTRSDISKGKPYEAVDKRKVSHLLTACQIYLLKNKIKDCKLSLDVISIWLEKDNSVREILHFEGVNT